MTTLLAIAIAWVISSPFVGLGIGRAIRAADQREQASVDEFLATIRATAETGR